MSRKTILQISAACFSFAVLVSGVWLSLQHNNIPQNAPLAYPRIYQGDLPCAGCQKTAITLTLTDESHYQILQLPDGASAPISSTGTWDILLQDIGNNAMRQIYRLDPDKPDTTRYFLPTNNGNLLLLTATGKKYPQDTPHTLFLQNK